LGYRSENGSGPTGRIILRRRSFPKKRLARGYFSEAALRRIYEEHVSGKRDHGYRMWALLMLELWHKAYID